MCECSHEHASRMQHGKSHEEMVFGVCGVKIFACFIATSRGRDADAHGDGDQGHGIRVTPSWSNPADNSRRGHQDGQNGAAPCDVHILSPIANKSGRIYSEISEHNQFANKPSSRVAFYTLASSAQSYIPTCRVRTECIQSNNPVSPRRFK